MSNKPGKFPFNLPVPPMRRPAAFNVNDPRIPTIGGTMPAVFKRFIPHVVLQCQCQGKSPIVITGRQIVTCPDCKIAYTVTKVAWDARTDQVEIEYGPVMRSDVSSNGQPVADGQADEEKDHGEG